MSININNYEIYFIDYFDGNLPEEVVAELMLFLDTNAELKEEFENFENINLTQDKIVFENKSSIKKIEILTYGSLNEENYENELIAYYEGDLDKRQRKEVESFINFNPSLQNEFNIHSKLILPKEEITYQYKAELKKKRIIPVWQYSSIASAASIILLVSIFWLLNDNSVVDNKIVINYNHIEPKTIAIQNDLNSEIPERELEKIILDEESSIIDEPLTIKYPNEDALAYSANNLVEDNNPKEINTEIPESIKFLKNQGQSIAITGEIDCAKLVKRKVAKSDDLYASVEKSQKKSLFSKIVNNNTNKLADAVSPNRNKKSQKNDKEPGLLKFLQGSVNVFNTLTGSEVEQVKVYDQDGNIKNYQIETQMLTLNKNYGPQGQE